MADRYIQIGSENQAVILRDGMLVTVDRNVAGILPDVFTHWGSENTAIRIRDGKLVTCSPSTVGVAGDQYAHIGEENNALTVRDGCIVASSAGLVSGAFTYIHPTNRQLPVLTLRGGVLVGGYVGGLAYLFRDDFTTAAAAPLTTPRNAEPGPGKLTIVDTSNQLTIAANRLKQTGTPPVFYTDPRIVTQSSYARAVGRAAVVRLNNDSGQIMGLSIGNAAALADYRHAAFIGTTAISFYADNSGSNFQIATISSGVDYYLAFIERATGCYVEIFGGAEYPDWTLLLVQDAYTSTPLYFSAGQSGAGNRYIDTLRIADLAAPFGNDSLAIINLAGTAQSIGAELLTNGNFALWGTPTADNPDNWIVSGEVGSDPAVHQVGSGEIHTGVGTGLANFYGTVAGLQITQAVLTSGGIYEAAVDTNTIGSQYMEIWLNNKIQGLTPSTPGTKRFLGRSDGNIFYIYRGSGGFDVTLDNATVKRLTLAPSQLAVANCVITRNFTLPASPVAGDRTMIWFRMPSAGSEFVDGWQAYIVRNDANTSWTIGLSSWAAGVETSRTTTTGVASADQLEVATFGNTIRVFARNGNNYVKYGADIVNALQNTSRYVNYVDGAAVTPGTFKVYAATASAVSALLNEMIS